MVSAVASIVSKQVVNVYVLANKLAQMCIKDKVQREAHFYLETPNGKKHIVLPITADSWGTSEGKNVEIKNVLRSTVSVSLNGVAEPKQQVCNCACMACPCVRAGMVQTAATCDNTYRFAGFVASTGDQPNMSSNVHHDPQWKVLMGPGRVCAIFRGMYASIVFCYPCLATLHTVRATPC